MPKQLKLSNEKCIGCKSCELACSLINGEGFNPAKARIAAITFLEGRYTLPYHFLLTCRQCVDAPCMKSCPAGAISQSKDSTKTIVVYKDLCTGCGSCVTACPFGVMFFDRSTKKPFKCELCWGKPACVEACPTEAIAFVQRRPYYAQEHDLQAQGYDFMKREAKQSLKRRSN